jgi:hypothetical protein
MDEPNRTDLEDQIAQWRSYLKHRQAIHAADVEELESHLRDEIDALDEAGLTPDEAFLVAVKRLGSIDQLSHEFAREHSDRLWKQLVLSPGEGEARVPASRFEFLVVLALAVLAASAIKLPELFGLSLSGEGQGFYMRNIGLLVLPILTGYFVWKRRLDSSHVIGLALSFLGAAAFVNIYPFVEGGHTEVLAALHLPIALWLVVGVAYMAGDWRAGNARMNFVRFSGELFIYYVLIALGGGVLMMFTLEIFRSIGLRLEGLAESWLLPCGAAGAVIVAAWLVEAKQSVIENMAPVLTRVFTPLFTLVLVAFLATMVWTGSGIDVAREVLIGFDLLLVLVLGLLLYSVSARDPESPPDAFDVLQLVLVISALVVDVLALVAIAGRISEFGFSPNKVAALGENIILLVNLAWSAVLYVRFLRGRGTFGELERWQTAYLPVYSAWAALVVLVFPPLFGYS